MNEDELIDSLSEAVGIVPEYYDIRRVRHITSLKTKRAILCSMGIDISEEGLYAIRNRKWTKLVEPVIALKKGQEIKIPLHFPLKEGEDIAIRWSLLMESGDYLSGEIQKITPLETKEIDGKKYVYTEIKLSKDIPLGYHDLTLKAEALEGSTLLIIAPDRCYLPEGRLWGLGLSLYGLSSEKNWAIGDLKDLKAITKGIGKIGAGFVGISPIHSIPNKKPYGISPYSPISRLYGNFIYIDIESVPEFKESPSFKSSKIKNSILELKKDAFIDYEKVASIKKDALRKCFSMFYKQHYLKGSQRAKEFNSFVQKEGRTLESYALYMSLSERFGSYDYRIWPLGYRSLDSKKTPRFKEEHKKQILFWCYVEWLLYSQLREVSKAASSSGMPIGIYQDLAVGTIKGGHEGWLWPDAYADGISLGAPPDDFNPNGQDWGLMTFIPERLRHLRYEPFIKTLRHNLRYSGALRIDHALGLFRLFWIPEGMSPEEGAYVKCYQEELLKIIALESVRNRAVIIAEDLGTVTEEARIALREFGLLSYRVFYFERRWPKRDFLRPEEYPPLALCCVNTHDLPTLYGFWKNRDIEIKDSLHIFRTEDALKEEQSRRETDKYLMLEALREFLPLDEKPPEIESILIAVYRFLASTACLLISMSLDDLLLEIDQQNLPGTVDKHPNWSRRYSLSVKEILKNERLLEISKSLQITFSKRRG